MFNNVVSMKIHAFDHLDVSFCLIWPQIDWGGETVSTTNGNIDCGAGGEEDTGEVDWGDGNGKAIDWGEGGQTNEEGAAIDWGDDGTADKQVTLDSCGITLEGSGQGKWQHSFMPCASVVLKVHVLDRWSILNHKSF